VPITAAMVRNHLFGISPQPKRSLGQPYVLISRGSNGRLRFERFDDADAYQRRLKEIEGTEVGTVSIDDVLSLLNS
jgi:hypothetical protein